MASPRHLFRGRFDVRAVANDSAAARPAGEDETFTALHAAQQRRRRRLRRGGGGTQPAARATLQKHHGNGILPAVCESCWHRGTKNPPSPMNAGPLRCHEYVEHLEQML